MKKVNFTLTFSCILLFLASCKSCMNGANEQADLSGIQLDFKISRFDKDLFATDPEQLPAELPRLAGQYGDFYALYMTQLIRAGDPNDPAFPSSLKLFVTDREIKEVYRDCQKEYPDLDKINDDLVEAFRHYKYYFPEKPVPRAVSFISGFNYGIISADNIIGIGLDMYLGKDYPFYKQLGYPNYKTSRMSEQYIVVDCMRGWGQSEFIQDINKTDFLNHLVYHGKIQYFIDRMLPDREDTLKWGFTPDQLKWCTENESTLWAFFIEKKLLYNVNSHDYFRYIDDGPTTNGLPKEAPSRTGIFIGWRIVSQYMKKNPEVTLAQLMNNNNAQEILTKSKYKP